MVSIDSLLFHSLSLFLVILRFCTLRDIFLFLYSILHSCEEKVFVYITNLLSKSQFSDYIFIKKWPGIRLLTPKDCFLIHFPFHQLFIRKLFVIFRGLVCIKITVNSNSELSVDQILTFFFSGFLIITIIKTRFLQGKKRSK